MPRKTRAPRTLAILPVLLLALGGACTPVPAGADGYATPVPLVEEGGRDRIGRLVYRGGIALHSRDERFGGLSDIRISPDGTAFTAVSDSAAAVMGRLSYDAAGTLTGAEDFRIHPLNGANGQPLVRKEGDAEGLVALPDGGWLVSFERDHRIVRYADGLGTGRAVRLDGPAGLSGLSNNGGLETLARLPDGRLLLIAEEGEEEGVSPGWIGRPGAWQAFRYKSQGELFKPVGATVLPDGDVLVAERRASWIGGWGSRIVLVPAAMLDGAGRTGATISGTEIGRMDPPMAVDNFEGIDARVTSGGRIMVYLVSDDNFQASQRTLLLMFELAAE